MIPAVRVPVVWHWEPCRTYTTMNVERFVKFIIFEKNVFQIRKSHFRFLWSVQKCNKKWSLQKNVAPSERNKTLNSENFKNSIRTNCQQPDQEAHVGLNYLFSSMVRMKYFRKLKLFISVLHCMGIPRFNQNVQFRKYSLHHTYTWVRMSFSRALLLVIFWEGTMVGWQWFKQHLVLVFRQCKWKMHEISSTVQVKNGFEPHILPRVGLKITPLV